MMNMYSRPRLRLPHQIPGRAPVVAELQDACRARMDAELVLDRHAADLVALPERAVRVDQHLRHDEERDAPHAGRRALDARQHHVDDVVGIVVLAPGDEDLLAGEPVVVALRHGARAYLPEVGAGLRLRQHHGAGPFPARHLGQEEPLLRLRAADLERVHRPVSQHRAELEREVRGAPELLYRAAQGQRHALAAEPRIGAELLPAVPPELRIRLLEALRRRYSLRRPVRAFAIAGTIERVEHGLREAGRLLQNRRTDLVAVVGEGGTGGELSGARAIPRARNAIPRAARGT